LRLPKKGLRAWIASGGRLAILNRQSPSLSDQAGSRPGLGRVVSDAGDLGLLPYGQAPRVGTDFEPDTGSEPSARRTPDPGPGAPGGALVILGWALGSLALESGPAGKPPGAV